MMADVDIFVGNNIYIDTDVYSLWLGGLTAQEAAAYLQRHGALQQYGATFEMLLSDTQDHYRTFFMLEKLLHQPPHIMEQIVYQIDPDTKRMLIQKYYEFDSVVIREILGKKMSTRNRKDLDDVSEKTKVLLRSCRRQFDNVKRVFKTVEEMLGSLVENIKMHFLLPDDLAQQYAAIVFITNNRFETGKKKLAYLTFDDFVHCASEMIEHWSYSSKDCNAHEDMDVDFDREFLIDLRDLKVLSEREPLDEHKMLVTKTLQGKLSRPAMSDLEGNFKNLSKALLNMANNLNQTKEMRDIFLDLVEKIIEPCKQGGWNNSEVGLFLSAYQETAHQLDPLLRNPVLSRLWDRYMSTMSSCISHMFHS